MHPLKSKYTALRTQDGDSFFFLGFLLLPFLSISHTPRDKPLPLPSELTRCSQHLSIIFSWRKYTCIVYVFFVFMLSWCHFFPSFLSVRVSITPTLACSPYPVSSRPARRILMYEKKKSRGNKKKMPGLVKGPI